MGKKFRSVFIIVLCISGWSCDKIDDLLTFTISDQTTFRMESTMPLNLPIEIATPDITTNSNQKFQNNNTSADLVKNIKLEELELSVTNPAGKTFSFLKSVHIYISTTQSNEIELAYQDNIPLDATKVTLIPTRENLDQFIKASSYKLRTSVVMRETLTQAVDVKVDLKFKVTAETL